MTLEIPLLQRTDPAQPTQARPLRDLTQTIRDGALAKALREGRAYAGDEFLLRLDLNRPAVLESLKDGLAQGTACALAGYEPRVQAIYTYDPSANPDNESSEDRPFDAVLHLLVLVTIPSAKLASFITELDQALADCLQDLPSRPFQGRESILDVIVLTEQEAQQRTGHAALLSSVFAPAIEIWRR